MNRRSERITEFTAMLLACCLFGCYAAGFVFHCLGYEELRNACYLMALSLFALLRNIKPKS